MRSLRTVLVCLVLLPTVAFAARHIGFQTDAFNRAYPSNYARNGVFSPVSFELDCALVAESLPTIPKADISARLGVVIDFAGTYGPVIEALAARTNGLSFVTARGFCLPEPFKTRSSFRRYLQETYGAEVMGVYPKDGAEVWFRTSMDGEMEDFNVADDAILPDRYSLYDLVSFSAAWTEPFPTANTREIPFLPRGETNAIPVVSMADVREAVTWETREYTMLVLPLRGGCEFYALLPKSGQDLSAARDDISSLEIDNLLTVTKSVGAPGFRRGPCVIVLPRFDLTSRVNLGPIFRYFRVPQRGLSNLVKDMPSKDLIQQVRFSLVECARGEKPLVSKEKADEVPVAKDTPRLVFNRPFLFFVHHAATSSVLVAGLFAGR